MKTSERINEVIDAITTLLEANRIATPNERVIGELRFQAAQLSACDTYAAEKAWDIVAKAETFYSARKHWKYPGGAERLYIEMTFDLLNRMRSQAARRKNVDD